MSRTIWHKILKFVGITAATVVLLFVALFFAINNPAIQNLLLKYSVGLLSEKLHTKVVADNVSITIPSADMKLTGLRIDDLQGREMLSIGNLSADIDLWRAIKGDVQVDKVALTDVYALIVKNDSVANFQFIIDAFRGDESGESENADSEKVTFNIDRISARNCHVAYNDKVFGIGKLNCQIADKEVKGLDAEKLSATFSHTNRKGVTTQYNASVGKLKIHNKEKLEVCDAIIRSDNHLPRKNTGKKNRGFFDENHLDVTANFEASILHSSNDSIAVTLDRFTAADNVAGIDIRELRCGISANSKAITISNAVIRQIDTELKFDKGEIRFPDKSTDSPLSYSTSTINGRVILKNISRAFAPPLRNFTTPLQLSVDLKGDNDGMDFNNVAVRTADKRLDIRAKGALRGLLKHDSHAIKVHFDVKPMLVDARYVESLLKQLPVKRMMMSQLRVLGRIRYSGSFDVVWRRQTFRGLLSTNVGSLNFEFSTDQNSKYLTGKFRTEKLEAGKILDMANIGDVAASAKFKIDLSKERIKRMRAHEGGKLPVGEASAHVSKASYKFITVTNIDGMVKSDGNVAKGSIDAPSKFVDISCDFSFTDTDNLHKMDVKPKMKLFSRRKRDK